MDSPAFEHTTAQPSDLFDGTEAEPPRRHVPANDTSEDQRRTLDRLMAHPTALLTVNALRIEQVTKHGHSDESDMALESVRSLPRAARDRIDSALEHLHGNYHTTESLTIARKQLAKGLAIGLAAIDRIDGELKAIRHDG